MIIITIESLGWKRETNPDEKSSYKTIYLKRNKLGQVVARQGDDVWEMDNTRVGVQL